MVRAAAAELVGTLVLVLVGTAVAVAAILGRQIAGSPYDSLAIALAFGLVLVALVGALGHTRWVSPEPGGDARVGEYREVPVAVCAGVHRRADGRRRARRVRVVGGVLGAVVYDKFIGPTTAPDEEQAGSANNG